MKKRILRISTLFLLMAFFAILTVGCGEKGSESKDGEDKLLIAVTIVPQNAFVKAVAGDLADIMTIVSPGSSSEAYEPTPKQLEDFANADIYFTIGVPVEQAKMVPAATDTVVIRLEERVAAVYPDREFEEDERDPHNWLSIKRAVLMTEIIAEELGKLDPNNADAYTANAAAYKQQLLQADDYIKSLFSSIEEDKRVFLVFHPAYGYFADDYGLTMYSLEEEGKEATAQDLQDMIDFAKEHGIKVMFIQEESASAQPTAFVQEVGGRVVKLDPLSSDYINNMKYMAEQIKEAME